AATPAASASGRGRLMTRPRGRIARRSLRVPRLLSRVAWPVGGRREAAPALDRALIPPDPASVLGPDLDPELVSIRRALAPIRRRLWLRRAVRRGSRVLAVVAGAELGLWALARFIPIEIAPTIGVAIPIIGLVALAIAIVWVRPSLGESAIAVDAEAHLGDQVTSALALAIGYPDSARP